MFCVRCGKRLEQGRCPSCGFVDNTYNGKPQATEGAVVVNEQQNKKGKAKKTKVKKVKEKKQGRLKAVLSKEKTQGKRTLTKKRKKAIIIIAAAGAMVLLVGAFLTVYLIRDAKYQQAISYLNNKPETAKQDFEELNNFKDSKQYLEDCNTLIAYNDAVDAYENEEYEDALEKFEELGRYEDSKDYVELCQDYVDYNGAKAFFDAGNFEQAKVIFVALGDFEDSIDMAASCQNNMDYNEGQTLFAVEDYEGAKRLFVGIPEFKDSEDMVFVCEWLIVYENALNDYYKGNYSSAAIMFEEVYNVAQDSSIDFKGKLNLKKLKYFQGYCYYYQDLFYSAHITFNSAKGYLDASSMAEKCKQPIVTEELYINPGYTRNSVKFTFYGKEAYQDACVKIYDGSTLVSVCLIEQGEKLKIYLPSGSYDIEVSYGSTWYGEIEAFGTSPSAFYSDYLDSDYYYWIDL